MGLSYMDYEEWQSSATKRFQKDVAHYQVSYEQVALWRRNIEEHPLVGTPVQGHETVGVYDYEVGAFTLRYVLIPMKRRVVLMMLIPEADDRLELSRRAKQAWGLLVDAVSIWSGVKGG